MGQFSVTYSARALQPATGADRALVVGPGRATTEDAPARQQSVCADNRSQGGGAGASIKRLLRGLCARRLARGVRHAAGVACGSRRRLTSTSAVWFRQRSTGDADGGVPGRRDVAGAARRSSRRRGAGTSQREAASGLRLGLKACQSFPRRSVGRLVLPLRKWCRPRRWWFGSRSNVHRRYQADRELRSADRRRWRWTPPVKPASMVCSHQQIRQAQRRRLPSAPAIEPRRAMLLDDPRRPC